MTVPVDDGRCFACGLHNPIGLHLRFEPDADGGVRGTVVLEPQFAGWKDVAHGGIVMTLLDEAMAYAAGWRGYRGMTASLAVRFRKPVPLGVSIVLRGRVLWMRRNVLGMLALVEDSAGLVLASGEGSFVAKGTIEPGKLGNPD